MSKEYFWGDELSGSKKEIKWNPSLDDEDDFGNFDSDGIQHFLFLKQAVLGPKAEKERNVVEITTENFDGDEVKQPLFSLKLDLNESSALDIGVQPPVTLTLVEGSGPVCISGQHMIEINDGDFDDNEDEDEEEEEEEEEDALDVKASPDLPKSKKRPLSTSGNVSKKTKMAKLDKDAGKDEEEEEEEDAEMAEVDDDDDDDDEDDEDSDEDEEEEDSDDEDEEEDDEDKEEEEDEESPEKPVKKPKGKKGHMNGTATAKGDSKTKTKAAKKTEKAKGKKKALTLDEIKQKLKGSSNVPKKEDKFKNFVRSSLHISESKKLQDLWSWYRASLQK